MIGDLLRNIGVSFVSFGKGEEYASLAQSVGRDITWEVGVGTGIRIYNGTLSLYNGDYCILPNAPIETATLICSVGQEQDRRVSREGKLVELNGVKND